MGEFYNLLNSVKDYVATSFNLEAICMNLAKSKEYIFSKYKILEFYFMLFKGSNALSMVIDRPKDSLVQITMIKDSNISHILVSENDIKGKKWLHENQDITHLVKPYMRFSQVQFSPQVLDMKLISEISNDEITLL